MRGHHGSHAAATEDHAREVEADGLENIIIALIGGGGDEPSGTGVVDQHVDAAAGIKDGLDNAVPVGGTGGIRHDGRGPDARGDFLEGAPKFSK